ncbi:MAG: sigma-70 family RNA polymerase sigma factor [Planctomycetaceae bacterium]
MNQTIDQDDAEFIEKVRGGNSSAFEGLVRKYQNRLYTALVHISGSRQEAEDIAQDAFVQAYRKLHLFAGNSSFYTWLYRIAVNAAISRKRKKRAEYSVEQTQAVTGDEPLDKSERVDERLLREERANIIQVALTRLPEEFRVVLVLREMEAFDYEAISETLDLPVGTVRSRLHRARVQLKEILSKLMRDPVDG